MGIFKDWTLEVAPGLRVTGETGRAWERGVKLAWAKIFWWSQMDLRAFWKVRHVTSYLALSSRLSFLPNFPSFFLLPSSHLDWRFIIISSDTESITGLAAVLKVLNNSGPQVTLSANWCHFFVFLSHPSYAQGRGAEAISQRGTLDTTCHQLLCHSHAIFFTVLEKEVLKTKTWRNRQKCKYMRIIYGLSLLK